MTLAGIEKSYVILRKYLRVVANSLEHGSGKEVCILQLALDMRGSCPNKGKWHGTILFGQEPSPPSMLS